MVQTGEGGAGTAGGPAIEGRASEGRMHLVTVEPLPGHRAWEHAWCTCGAHGEFRVDGPTEDWALSHPSQHAALGHWRAIKAS